jgi:lactate dehydrogenase-like 2-hydroxyacid dehydrogenase
MMVKPGVLMHGSLPYYLPGLLEPKYRVFPLWEQSDKEAYLAENAESIRGLIASAAMWVDAALIDKLPKLEIVSKTGVGVDRVCLLLLLLLLLKLGLLWSLPRF